MSDELKPVRCGCGGVGKIQTDHDTVTPAEPIDWKRVVCDNCNIRTTWRHTEAEAITAWNKAMGAKDINVPNKSVENIYSVGDHDKIYVYGFCPECGSAVIKPDKYCSECGCRLEWK